MKYIFSLAIFLVFSLSVSTQNSEIFTDFGIGLLSHQPLKTFHEGLSEQLTIEGFETTDNYGINYGFSIGFKINSIKTSFFFQNKVAGAKSSVADFSGYIRLTDELRGYTFGGIYEFDLQQFKKGSLSFGVKGLITSSKLIVKSESNIANSFDNDVLNFRSIDFGSGAIMIYRYPLKVITLRATLGADFYIGGKLKFEDMKEAHLLDSSGNKVTTGWSGLNLGIGIAFPLAN
ncbi:hypothetical protein [Hyunsoonleella ulvae]|uniref:hypothetical protein n=1 Tax=Hyunsoonleella ulvae TaxID=2799948 RepID=UPI00193A1B8C|nr:hypothetical protein [Hyunsoonleella ulvae]